MKKILFLFSGVLLSAIVHCQLPFPDYGDIDPADLRLKSCPFEPDAPAMKMLDIQEIHFDLFSYGTRTKTERRIRIKIFNEKGYQFSTIRIPYFSKKGVAKIKEIKGIIYNLDPSGKIVAEKIDRDDFFKEKAVENIGIVSFTFPHVKPGSIIEYRYTTIENDILSIKPWIIQGEIPVAYSTVIVTTPASSAIMEWVMGADSVEQSFVLLKNDAFRRTTFFKSNIPSFTPEPFMSSYNDHLIRVLFSLFPFGNSYYEKNRSGAAMWKVVGSQLLRTKYFEKQIGKMIPGTESFIDSVKKNPSITERIRLIFDTVKNRWSGDPEQTLDAKDLAEAWDSKKGTTTEINLILLNFLEKADIKCFPVLISTRDHGKVNKDFPAIGQLNGLDVMAFDTSRFYLLDASHKFQSFLNIPQNILNREAFFMSPDSMEWITVADKRPLLKESTGIVADMKENGQMEGTANIQYFDYAKSNRLDTIHDDDENRTRDEKYQDTKPVGLKIISFEKELTDQADDPLFETTRFTYDMQNTGEFYFINPRFFSYKDKNPFKTENRNTDIDLGCNQLFVFSAKINLGNSFEVDHLPKNVIVRAPDSSLAYSVTYASGSQSIFISQLFEIKRAIYSKEDYPGIRDFYKQMYALMAEEIIVKKKK